MPEYLDGKCFAKIRDDYDHYIAIGSFVILNIHKKFSRE